MQTQSPLETEIAVLLVSALNLRDVNANTIDPETSLSDGDLAMDSIDVLELSLAISKKYSVNVETEDNEWRDAFTNLKSIAKLVESLKN